MDMYQARYGKFNIGEQLRPKTSGSLQGLRGSLQTESCMGNATFSYPLPLFPCRNSSVNLSLLYFSGGGNGPFGQGFSLNIPSIYRMDNRGIPSYSDKDIFVSTEYGELSEGNTIQKNSYVVTFFYPVIEKEFVEIQHWVNSEEDYWLVKANAQQFIYGKSDNSRVVSHENCGHIYKWMLEDSVDNRKNRVLYQYKKIGNNTYIDSVQYGNYRNGAKEEKYFFHVIFLYDENRSDTYSSYSSGFLIETCCLCKEIHIAHYFEEGLMDNKIIKLFYEKDGVSLLKRIETIGCRNENDEYIYEELPPITFEYTKFQPLLQNFEKLDLPASLLNAKQKENYYFLDLYGEGLDGILYQCPGCVMYYPPLGKGHYGNPINLDICPNDLQSDSVNILVLSLEGNGKYDFLIADEIGTRYYAQENGCFNNCSLLDNIPSELSNPYAELADMEGNGKKHLLVINGNTAYYYPSNGKLGYKQPVYMNLPSDYPKGVSDRMGKKNVFTDIFGDGLSHKVCIENGRVSCWPNLGYGRFGECVYMENAPSFESFDARRVWLSDLNGNGASDLIYVYPDKVDVFFNTGGKSFGDKITLVLPEVYTENDSIYFADMYGNGCQCLVFCKKKDNITHYYYNFSGIDKPYLLKKIDLHTGVETQIRYKSSVLSYLEDKQKGDIWKLKPFFPVQVIQDVCNIDRLLGHKHRIKYEFKNCWYDFRDRLFRGFENMQQWTWEEYDIPENAENIQLSEGKHVKRTYCINGIVENKYKILNGLVCQDELYGWRPGESLIKEKLYQIEKNEYEVLEIKPAQIEKKGRYLAYKRETLNYIYEGEANPRIQHDIISEIDSYGFPTIRVVANYRKELSDIDTQKISRITVFYSDYAHILGEVNILGVPIREKIIEISDCCHSLSYEELKSKVEEINKGHLVSDRKWFYWNTDLDKMLPLGEVSENSLLHHTEDCAFTKETIEACVEKLSNNKIDKESLENLLEEQGGYFYEEGGWYRKNPATVYYGEDRFFMPAEIVTPWFRGDNKLYYRKQLSYDPYCLMLVNERSYLGDSQWNEKKAEIDYQAIQYLKIIDWNDNCLEQGFDALGNVRIYTEYGTENDISVGNRPLSEYKQVTGSIEDMINSPEKYLQGASAFYAFDYSAYDMEGVPLRAIEIESKDFGNKEVPVCRIHHFDGLGKPLESCLKTENAYSIIDSKSYDLNGQEFLGYPPYQANGWEYKKRKDEQPIIHQYDALGRETMTSIPIGSCPQTGRVGRVHTKSVYNVWSKDFYDANQNIKETEYYNEYASYTPKSRLEEKQKDALEQGGIFEGMPIIESLDCFGRTVLKKKSGIDDAYTTITYDSCGNINSLSDSRLEKVEKKNMTAVYDLFGDMMYFDCSDSGSKLLVKNVYGNEFLAIDGNNNCIRKEYDHLQRLQKVYADGIGLIEKIVYGDGHEEATKRNLCGHIQSYYTQSGVENYNAYDILGHCISKHVQFVKEYFNCVDWNMENEMETDCWEESYAFDRKGNLLIKNYPDGTREERSYNLSGYLNRLILCIDNCKINILEDASYLPDGSIANRSYGNHTKAVYEQDRFSKRRSCAKLINTENLILQNLQYIYDPMGNITYIANPVELSSKAKLVPQDWEYEYDALYQLIKSKGRKIDVSDNCLIIPYVEQYKYDKSGNLVYIEQIESSKKINREISICEDSNRVKSMDGKQCQYDNNGNLLFLQDGLTLCWDWNDQLIKAEKSDREKEYYTYDLNGERKRKITINQGVVTTKYYVNDFELTRCEGQDQKVFRIISGEDLFAEIIIDGSQQPKVVYKYQDHLNSVSLELNDKGDIITWEEYDSHGDSVLYVGSETMPKTYKYAGKEKDTTTGLYYFGARYYDGLRFISSDSIDYINANSLLGLNLYAYCENNPIKYKDLDGHCIHYFVGSGQGLTAKTSIDELSTYLHTEGIERPIITHSLTDQTTFEKEWMEINNPNSVVVIAAHGTQRRLISNENDIFLNGIQLNPNISTVAMLSCNSYNTNESYWKESARPIAMQMLSKINPEGRVIAPNGALDSAGKSRRGMPIHKVITMHSKPDNNNLGFYCLQNESNSFLGGELDSFELFHFMLPSPLQPVHTVTPNAPSRIGRPLVPPLGTVLPNAPSRIGRPPSQIPVFRRRGTQLLT